ncbi:glycosyltransferase family 4 protein [Dankookia sp. GCM10030260]|uniref:glycosyltransferase family 4 protein n=1 Tax=Dankookia sp. GCM10030260 TaxID=3273390 RepID=UPI00361AB31C
MTTETLRRILMTADAVGGIWPYALDLARGLAAQGVQTVLAVSGPPPEAAQTADASAVPGLVLRRLALPLDWLAERPAEVVVAGQTIAAVATQEGVDLVQLNSPALAAGISFPVAVVGVCHSCVATWWQRMRGTPLPEDFAWRSALVAKGYAACDALVAPTTAFAVATAQAYCLATPPRVVHNGRQPPADTTICQADFVFTAGRLWDEGKDLATLDRAAARLPMPVIAAGPVEGPNGTRLRARHLRLLGRLDAAEVSSILARGPIFVSTACYEPFGLAVLEAAQAGCVLVLSDIPSFRELWDGAAVFVPPMHDAALAEAIFNLVQDREGRTALSCAARERGRRYDFKKMAAGMLNVYRSLVQLTHAVPPGHAA